MGYVPKCTLTPLGYGWVLYCSEIYPLFRGEAVGLLCVPSPYFVLLRLGQIAASAAPGGVLQASLTLMLFLEVLRSRQGRKAFD